MDPITINLAILAASYILSSVLAPKPQKPKPAAFDAADFPLCEEGKTKRWCSASAGRSRGWCSPWTIVA